MSAWDLEADLDAFLIGDEWPTDEPPPVPEDAAGASRLLLAIRSREKKIESFVELAKERIDQATAWRDDRTSGLRRSIEHIERSLNTWMRAHHEATGQVTTKLPDGELKLRPGSPALAAPDEPAAIVWARTNRPGWVRTTYAIVKDDAKKDLTAGPKIEDPKLLEVLGELPDTHEWRKAIVGEGDEAEIVPGLAIREPVQRVFGYATMKPKKPKQQRMPTPEETP